MKSQQGKTKTFWRHKHFSMPPHFPYVIQIKNNTKLQKYEMSNKVVIYPMMNAFILSLKHQIYSYKTNFFFWSWIVGVLKHTTGQLAQNERT